MKPPNFFALFFTEGIAAVFFKKNTVPRPTLFRWVKKKGLGDR